MAEKEPITQGLFRIGLSEEEKAAMNAALQALETQRKSNIAVATMEAANIVINR